jgi:hypothetical protein
MVDPVNRVQFSDLDGQGKSGQGGDARKKPSRLTGSANRGEPTAFVPRHVIGRRPWRPWPKSANRRLCPTLSTKKVRRGDDVGST